MKFLILILLIMNSCNPFIDDWDMRPSNAVDEVLKKHEINYVNKLPIGARVCATGGGGVYGINLFTLEISTKEVLTIDLARKLLVEGVYQLLEEINTSNTMKEYLAFWPMTIENIRYGVNRKLNGTWIKYPNGFDGEISFAKYMHGKIFYAIDIADNKMFEDVYVETFEEAVKKLDEEDRLCNE